MKMRDIMQVIDIDRIKTDDLRFIVQRFARDPLPPMTPEEQQELWSQMYADEAGDLEIEQQRENLRKTRAQADKLQAEADRAHAAADAQRAGTNRSN